MMNEANDVFDRGSLPELLANRARQATDTRLAANVGAGLLLASSVLILQPPFWIPLAALGLCFVAYGAWGILERETQEASGSSRRAVAAARNAAVVLGATAAIVFGVSLFFALLGPIIS